jgi:hypothetical protein
MAKPHGKINLKMKPCHIKESYTRTCMGTPDGTIAPGKIANLILIDGDPKKNIKDIRKIYLTIKEGKIYSPKRIYAAYGWKYYY